MDTKRIFVSHSAREGKIAEKLTEMINDSFLGKIESFVSGRDIPPGRDWVEEITQALTVSDMLLVLCSPESIRRPWVNFEIGYGKSKEKNIIPICYFGLNIEGLIESPLHHFRSQAIFIDSDFNEGLTLLYKSLSNMLECNMPKPTEDKKNEFYKTLESFKLHNFVMNPPDAFFRGEKEYKQIREAMIENAKKSLFINTVSLGIMPAIHDLLLRNENQLEIHLVQYDKNAMETNRKFIDMHRGPDLTCEILMKQFSEDELYFCNKGAIMEIQKKHNIEVGQMRSIMPVSFIAVDYEEIDGDGVINAQHQGFDVVNHACPRLLATYKTMPKLYKSYWEQINKLWAVARHNTPEWMKAASLRKRLV